MSNIINTVNPTPYDRMHPRAFTYTVGCSKCDNEFGVTREEWESSDDVPCPVCVHKQPNPKVHPYHIALMDTVAALEEAAEVVRKMADLLTEGKPVDAGKLAYAFYGERYTPYHSCFRFPAACGFSEAIRRMTAPYEDDCAERGINPDTGNPYDG